MKKPLVTLILCILSVIVFSQDIIYTVSGEIVNSKTSLDSILVENLTTGKSTLFGNLPALEVYQINLTQNAFWGSVGIAGEKLQVFSETQNQPGLLSVAYFGNTPCETRVTVFNLNGQIILSKSETIYPGKALQVRLTTQGVFFVQFDSPAESRTFKAAGAFQAASFDILLIDINPEIQRNKSGILSEAESTIFLPGDTIRVSVYKNGYYARPQGMKIATSSALNFPFDVSAVAVNGTSDGYVELNMNSTDITAFDTLTGNVQIKFTGEKPGLLSGDVITIDLDTMGYLRKVVQTTTSDNVVFVETEPAYMNEIFIDKEIKLNTGLMNPGVQLKSNASMEEISAALTDENGYIHPMEVYYHTNDGQVITKSAFTATKNGTAIEPLFNFTRDLRNDLYGKSGDNVHLYISEGNASLTANAVFEMDFYYKGELDADTKVKKSDLRYFTFYLEGDAGFQTKIALDLKKAFENEDKKKLWTFEKITTKFVVGAIPVWITFSADIYGNYKVAADASVHADFGFESSHNVKVGGTYTKASDSFTPIKTYTPVNKVYPLNLEGQVNANVRMEIYPRTEIKFYGFFGPYAEIVPYVQGKYNARVQSQVTAGGAENFLAWNSGIDLGLDFRVGSELTFLWGLFNKEYGPTVLNGPVWPMWKSPTDLALLIELPGETTTGNTIPLSFKVTDLLENLVSLCPIYLTGTGSFNHQIIFTDYNGEANAEWTISNNPGQNELIATIYNADKSIIKQKSYFVNSINIPMVTTTAITSITQTTATSGGNVTADGGATITVRGICWNTAGNPTTADNKTTNGTGTGSFISSLTGLTGNTPYYVRAYATNSQGTAYGEQVAFTTGQTVTQPTVTTTSITAITQTTATGGGNVTADGGATVTVRGICWNTNPNPTTANNKTTNGTGTGSFTSNLTGLTANTPYYVRAYATNSLGTAYGNQVAFTTGQTVTQPTVTTTSITAITQTTASGGGNVTADGGTPVTVRGICWSTNPNPTTANNKTTNGTGTGSFTSNLTGLTANTPYYIRAYATNSQGTTYGNEVMFTTTAEEGPVFGSFTDSRDGHVYKTVTIGTQVWMAENLAYLPAVSPASTGSNIDPYYYVYGYNGTNVATAKQNSNYSNYGVLYNWPAAKAACPLGWHLPSDDEWKQLEMLLGMTQEQVDVNGMRGTDQGTQMKTISGWDNNSNGTNTSKFSALPGGYRITIQGVFGYVGEVGYWWSSSESNTLSSWIRQLNYYSNVYRGNVLKDFGFSVRCVRDAYIPSFESPTVTTDAITSITQTTATGGGNVTADGGTPVTARGICWSTSPNPTTANNKTTNGTGTGSFTSTLTGLTANTKYYVRAYATNSQGTAYGNEVSFTTTAEEGPVFGSFTDPRDGHVYKTVTIGTQVWMAENLAYLPAVNPSSTGSNINPYYYVYDYEGTDVAVAKQHTNYNTYGVMYNWPAALSACPLGWHLPSEEEWTILTTFLGGYNVAGGKMKETGTTHWNSPNTGATNERGFSALPCGSRFDLGTFDNMGIYGNWWSSSEYDTNIAWSRVLYNDDIQVARGLSTKGSGFSVRCVRD